MNEMCSAMIPSRFWRGVVTGLHLSSVLFQEFMSLPSF
jgi:hypothetical protein